MKRKKISRKKRKVRLGRSLMVVLVLLSVLAMVSLLVVHLFSDSGDDPSDVTPIVSVTDSPRVDAPSPVEDDPLCSVIYMTPPPLNDVLGLLERFSQDIACGKGTLVMGSPAYSLSPGTQETTAFGVGNDVSIPHAFDISVGCYHADVYAPLKKIRFHSFASYSEKAYNVTAIRMTIDVREDTMTGTYDCAVFVCENGSSEYCYIPRPEDWPEYPDNRSFVPAYNSYGQAKFQIMVQ